MLSEEAINITERFADRGEIKEERRKLIYKLDHYFRRPATRRQWAEDAVFEMVSKDRNTADVIDLCRKAHESKGTADQIHSDVIRDVFPNPFQPPPLVQADGHLLKLKTPVTNDFEQVCHWLTEKDGFIPSLANQMYDNNNFTEAPILADFLEEMGLPDSSTCHHCEGKGQEEKPIFEPVPDIKCLHCGGILTYRTDIKTHDKWCGRCWTVISARCTGYDVTVCSVCKGARKIPDPILAHLRSTNPHHRGCWVIDAILNKERNRYEFEDSAGTVATTNP